ncbi:hypothetical protein BD779DRAFT_1575948 [Infundibulicybe gibba]|nr:hypothetical protein BD779DRAFT_1575948 [Infundibulicybe gibba]
MSLSPWHCLPCCACMHIHYVCWIILSVIAPLCLSMPSLATPWPAPSITSRCLQTAGSRQLGLKASAVRRETRALRNPASRRTVLSVSQNESEEVRSPSA